MPEAYLARFADEETGFLHVYSRRTKLWRRQKPKQVMVRNRYYHQHWAPEGVDKNILEKRLGQELEPKGLIALEKLRANPELLTDDDAAQILTYLEFQRLRVPRQAEMAKELAKNALTLRLMQDPKTREALTGNKIVMKDSFRFEYMRGVNGSLTPYMSKMVWEVVRAKNEASFITSDSPVSFYNVEFPPPTEAGIALYGTMVFFPLDPEHMLVLRHPEYFRDERQASDTLPRDLEIEGGSIEIRRDTEWDQNAVNRYNWLMFQLSQDLIVGNSKEALELTVGEKLHGN